MARLARNPDFAANPAPPKYRFYQSFGIDCGIEELRNRVMEATLVYQDPIGTMRQKIRLTDSLSAASARPVLVLGIESGRGEA